METLLEKIPFVLCQVTEDNERVKLYYLGEEVLDDYNDVAHYLSVAIALFKQVRNKKASWLNLENLWKLRNCVRENYNHGLGLDHLIYGKNFDGEHINTITPLTKQRFELIIKVIHELDEYATI